jgi:radical SAM family uncharacterized protein
MSSFKDRLNALLIGVEKPARYTGGEFNTPDMSKPVSARYCFCFPDVYEIGMSNLGLQILYDIINKQPDFLAERCFAPWVDMADAMRKNGIPLLSLETATPLAQFDVVGFSIQFELLYTNVLYMLDLAGIPFWASERGEEFPFIIAGGPCAVNPEPFAEFFDAVLIGEGEENNLEFLKLVAQGKKEGLTKTEILSRAKEIEGVYVPSQHIAGETVKKAVVRDFENASYPERPLVPNINVVHDRATLEIYRGCASGCRFCQAGFYYRPIRERSVQTLADAAKKIVRNTGFDELSLCSLSAGDYSGLWEFMEEIRPYINENNVNLSLPSLRLSGFDKKFAESSRKSSLTFAPEAGTQRLRDVINKNITDRDIENIGEAFSAGYDSVKLYFMMGLPTETDEDLDGIAAICRRLRDIYFSIRGKKHLNISVSCSVFIPKPCTPFEREAQIDIAEMLRRQNYVRRQLKDIKGVSFSWHGAESSKLECALARGDKKLSRVLVRAYKNGCKFDGWSERFNWDAWQKSFEEEGVDMDAYTREIEKDAPLPWEFIDIGVSRAYFERERQKAYAGATTKSCREGCNACGANAVSQCTIIGAE